MTKSQFNIKISKELLTQVKRQATKSGKTLTEHITDLISKSLSENDLQDIDSYYPKQIKDFEERLLDIESIVSNREYLSKKLTPFTNLEAINCTKFMRGFFEKELKKKNFENKKKAFDDLFKHIKIYNQLNQLLADRLQEIMIEDNPNPWTGNELNELSGVSKCNCPIRKGLINWSGITNCPSQQEICDKGEELLT